MKNLYQYTLDVIERLNSCPVKNYGESFVSEKFKFFEIFQREKKIIFSSSHGIDFFNNIIKYWDNPDEYKEVERDKEGKPKGDLKYENNFINFIKQHK